LAPLSQPNVYTADSVAVLGYLAEALPSKVDDIFRRAEDDEANLIIPTIALGETIFTLLKGRKIFGHGVPPEKLSFFLDTLESTHAMVLADLDIKGWKLVMKTHLPEPHDRMIVATYLRSNSKAILTDDREIASLPDVKAIWN
jgi:predicted nucleic acid-binding protein